MKKSNLFILVLSLLLTIFCTNVYAQKNSDNTNQKEYNNDEFEFEVELIYDDGEGDDDDSDEGDSDDDDDDEGDDDDSDEGDDDDDSDNDNQPIGAQITVTNNGVTDIDNDIIFRAHIGDEVPENIPNTYHQEEILYLLDSPLEPDEEESIFMDLVQKKRGGKVITIWPLVSDNKSTKDDIPFIVIVLDKTNNSEKILTENFSEIKVYPNPTNGILNLYVPKNTLTNQITIYNQQGQAVKILENIISGSIRLDMSDLSQGIYFVAVKDEKSQIKQYTKLMIHK